MIIEPKPAPPGVLAPVVVVRAGDIERVAEIWGGRTLSVVPCAGIALLATDAPIDPKTIFEMTDRVASIVPAVPVRAGGRFETPEAARRFVRAGSGRFEDLLDVAARCDEWSVRLSKPGDDAPADPLGGDSPMSYLAQRRRAMAGKSGVPAWAMPDLELLSAELGPVVEDTSWLPAGNGGASLALLVPRDREAALEQAFEEAAERLRGAGILSGPYPIYSFCTLR